MGTANATPTHSLALTVGQDTGHAVLHVATSFGASFVADPPLDLARKDSLIVFLSPCCRGRIYSEMGVAGSDRVFCGRCDGLLGRFKSAQRIHRDEPALTSPWRMGDTGPLESYVQSFMDPLSATLATARLREVFEELYCDQDWLLGHLDRVCDAWDGVVL